MKDREALKKLMKEQEKEDMFFKEQVKDNSLDPNFRIKSINQLIDEILTRLTGVDSKGNRYSNEILSEIVYSNIEELEKLYLIRNLESSYKSNNRND
jgi:predicted DNA-binding protein|nr:MAG TPA: hypothetical protein [Caudoviricetes sp.]